MAHRVEIGEIVENATGLNITGASVTVRYHGGANAPVYDAEIGGSLITQPLTTVNGKIGADYPSGAWVAEDTDYDFDVVFGGDTLTFFWPATRAMQFVTTLPAGVGTSAPEDAELAVELYDATNGGAWLRRYRAAASAWDMIGGPPPAGGSLPGSPRTRQEFYLTGATPPVQHMRYNGASWDYVGTPPTVPVTGSPVPVLDVGQSGQRRAGRQLSNSDFNTMLGLSMGPYLVANLTTLSGAGSNLGVGGNLSNRNSVANGNGIDGAATAAQFTGGDKCLYIDDTGGSDPFRIKAGSMGCWMKTARHGTEQNLITKASASAGQFGYLLRIGSNNLLNFFTSHDGSATMVNIDSLTFMPDDRWHFVVATYDGAIAKLYVDGVLEGQQVDTRNIFGSNAPFNLGARAGNAGTAANSMHYGRIDEAFLTPEILSEEQVRFLMAAAIPHGYATTPTRVYVSVRRKRRGAALVTGDFPSTPPRLYTHVAGSLSNLGSDANGAAGTTATLANNGTSTTANGADGMSDSASGAFHFIAASSQSLSATDAGLPATTASRTYGCWMKTAAFVGSGVMGWGTITTNDARLATTAGGLITAASGGDVINGPFIADGGWHFVVVVEDNGALDSKRKLYVDSKLFGVSNTLNSITLAGANRFRIGANPDATAPFNGEVTNAFVFAGVLTQEDIAKLMQKSSQTILAGSPKDAGEHVEGYDPTNVFAIFDTIEPQNTIDIAVAA